jgi:hypothetical protein
VTHLHEDNQPASGLDLRHDSMTAYTGERSALVIARVFGKAPGLGVSLK